ncbi:hypothetical protein VSX64_15255 [Aurantimonas sp. C2-6-R+9]|uniref:hypothetical protein n=1 Tax=unclassified Aurantimonas TaxID=2638230 RepID=UPI002E17E1EF|nr:MULTISPECIES: hypothetical protein [unclassified Aurantimonas]MEC5292093.1 hypothetical protein [Aurantimonas sp. C2-3-R2]MEC5382226.1 hypothetical protein [Aurantimonas sp. C2-6-R+9]MEC5413179.1 hypothetical protein [Aurantimonas sp. C2-4-R8]
MSEEPTRLQRHREALAALENRDEISLKSNQIIGLLAYLSANAAFQQRTITALAAMALGEISPKEIEQLIASAEQSTAAFDYFVEELAGTRSDE